MLERGAEAVRVGVDLALVDDALLVVMQELDRILDRHDVLGPGLVDLVDHRGQGGRLAAAGRAGDEHQTARQGDQGGRGRRETDLVERRRRLRDDAKDGADRALLHEQIAAEAGQPLDAKREVEFVLLLEELLLLLGEHAVAELAHVVRRQLLERHGRHVPVDAHHRGRIRGQVEVGGLAAVHLFEKLVDLHPVLPLNR